MWVFILINASRTHSQTVMTTICHSCLYHRHHRASVLLGHRLYLASALLKIER